MSSMFSNFFGRSAAPVAAPTASPGGGIQHGASTHRTVFQNPNPAENLNGQQPGTTGAPAAPAPPADPINSHLDPLQGVWQTPTDADGKPLAPQADPLYQPLFNAKPEDVRKQIDTLDFTSNLNPELAGKALGGDPTALMELIGGVAKNVMVASTLNTGHLLNQSASTTAQRLDQSLPAKLRNHAIATTASSDKLLSHPGVAPMVQAMKGVLAKNNPHWTPEQVQQASEEFFNRFGSAYSEVHQTPQQQAQKRDENVDWMKAMGLSS